MPVSVPVLRTPKDRLAGYPYRFADAFARADGPIGNGWHGSTWMVSSGHVVNTPSVTDMSLANGDLETWVGGPDSQNAGTWTESAGLVTQIGVGCTNAQGVTQYAGSYSADFNIVTGVNAQITQGKALTFAQWYRMRAVLRTTAATKKPAMTCNNVLPLPSLVARDPGTNWVQYINTFRCSTVGTATLGVRHSSGTGDWHYFADNIDLYSITLTDLYCWRKFGSQFFDISVDITRLAGCQAGLMLNIDNPAAPANYILVYQDGLNTINVDKVVGGTYQAPVATHVKTYGAGQKLRILHTPDQPTYYEIWYNGAIVATDVINDAGIINNRYHALWSTDPGNSLDNFACLIPSKIYTRGAIGMEADPDVWLLEDGTSKWKWEHEN